MEEETQGGDTKRKEEDQGREQESEVNKRGRYQVGGSSGSGGTGDWWNTEGFGKSYEPFNPMDFEDNNQERGQKRTAEQDAEGQREETRPEKDTPDMRLGWIHEARGEQGSEELRVENLEMGHLLNVTEGIQISKRDMPISNAKKRIETHVRNVSRSMEQQQDMARYFCTGAWKTPVYFRNLGWRNTSI